MKRIVVIEDEKPVLANILEILDSGGFQAIAAHNGEIGLRLIREQPPDLVLCDILMPNLDGYGVFEQLRQDPQTALIPFIFLTAKADHSDIRQGMGLGADDYLTKPFRRQELLDAITVRLSRHQALTHYYRHQLQHADQLQQKVQELEHLSATQEKLLQQLVEDLRRPLSNLNLAIHLLRQANSQAQRDYYLQILSEEFSREIALLNRVTELQSLLTPENLRLLWQFNLLDRTLEPSLNHPPSV